MSFITGAVSSYQGASAGIYPNADSVVAPVPPPPVVPQRTCLALYPAFQAVNSGDQVVVVYDSQFLASPNVAYLFDGTATIQTAGMYDVTATVLFSNLGLATPSVASIVLQRNGIPILQSVYHRPSGAGGATTTSLIVTGLIPMLAGDALQVLVSQNTGFTSEFGNINGTSEFGCQLQLERVA
jgi:hypothetical protein